MAELAYLSLYYSYLDAIKPLGDAERGRLFTALLEYGKTGATPELCGNERFLFPMMQGQMDRDKEMYEKKCRKNSENKKRSLANVTVDNERKRSSTNEAKEKKKEKEKEKKNEKKKKNIPSPLPSPAGEGMEDVFRDRNFSPAMETAISEWLQYKSERREKYQPTGLSSLLSQIEHRLEKLDEDTALFVITESMARNYKGIIWDLAEKKPKETQRYVPPDYTKDMTEEELYLNGLL